MFYLVICFQTKIGPIVLSINPFGSTPSIRALQPQSSPIGSSQTIPKEEGSDIRTENEVLAGVVTQARHMLEDTGISQVIVLK